MENHVQGKYSESWKEDNIIHQVIYRSVKEINLTISKELMENRQNAMGSIGVKYNFILIATSVTKFNMDCRNFYSNGDYYHDINFMAIITNNYTSRFVLELIFNSNNFVPVKVVNSREKALKWLNNFNRMNN